MAARLLLGLLLVLGSLGVLSGCQQAPPPTSLEVSGTLEAREVKVAPRIAGRVASLPPEGADVKQGAVIVKLSVPEFDDQLRAAQASLESTRQRLREAEVALKLQTRLNDSQISGARSGIDAAEARVLQAQSALRSQVLTRDSQVDQARTALNVARAALRPVELERDLRRRDLKRLQQLYRDGFVPAQKVDEARTALSVTEARLRAAQEQVRLAQSGVLVVESQSALDAVREADIMAAQAGVETARSQLLAAEAQRVQEELRLQEIQVARSLVQQAEAALALARTQIAHTQLSSPVSGRVIRRTVEAGELVAPGQAVLTVADLTDIWVEVFVPAPHRERVHLGMEIPVAIDSFPGRSFTGKVVFISPEAEFTPKNIQTREERVTRTYKVRVQVPNSKGELFPGMAADVRISLVGGSPTQ